MKLNEANYNNGENELPDNHWINVCFESNIIDVPSDTWWLDSGATCDTPNPKGLVDHRQPAEKPVCLIS